MAGLARSHVGVPPKLDPAGLPAPWGEQGVPRRVWKRPQASGAALWVGNRDPLDFSPGSSILTVPWSQFPSLYWGQWEVVIPRVFGALTFCSSELVAERKE